MDADAVIKIEARKAVRAAVQRGELTKPDTCEHCKQKFVSSYITAHHHNGYDEPYVLDVQWLCRRCHGAVHGGVLNIPSEQHRADMIALNESRTPEERSVLGRHAALSVSPEQRVANAKKARAAASTSWYSTMTPEERSAKMRDQVGREKQVTCSCGKIGRGAVIANHRKRTNCA